MELRETGKKTGVTTHLVNGVNTPIVRKVQDVEYPATRTTSKVIIGGIIKKLKVGEDGHSFAIVVNSLPYFDADLCCEIGGENFWVNFNDKFDAQKFTRQLKMAERSLGRTVTIKATKQVDVCSDDNATTYTSYFGSDIKSGVRTTQAAIGAPIDGIFLNGKLSVTEDINGAQQVSILVGSHQIPGTDQMAFHWIKLNPSPDFKPEDWNKVPDANGTPRLKNALVVVDPATWKPVETQLTMSNGGTYKAITGGSCTATAIYSGEAPQVEEAPESAVAQ